MPRLASILLHSTSGDGYNDLTPLSTKRRGPCPPLLTSHSLNTNGLLNPEKSYTAGLRRNDYAALHIGMILAEIVDGSRLFHHQPCRLLRRDGNIPVAVRGGGGMRQNVLVDPFDSVPDLRRYFGWDKDELVDRHLNCRRLRLDG